MTINAGGAQYFRDAWDVLRLFLIPVGGGIPGGVMLARARGFSWPMSMLLYLVSDIVLACLFEPILRMFIRIAPRVPLLFHLIARAKLAVQKSVAYYGNRTGPISLVMISFGVDPMTGRAAAIAAGYGFVVGWMIAIAGDMIYFTILMVCTLWLQSVLGDGTVVMLIVLGLMVVAPYIFRRIRDRRTPSRIRPGSEV